MKITSLAPFIISCIIAGLAVYSNAARAATVTMEWGYTGIIQVDEYSIVVDGVEVDGGPYTGSSGSYTLLDQAAGDYTASVSICNSIGCVEKSVIYTVPDVLNVDDITPLITITKGS